MEKIPLPTKIEINPGADKNSATVVIEPCFPGYGVTLGNALRRVLLSSLPGAAVTSFKLAGTSHEFSTIDYVKEDLVEIALNLKLLRCKLHSENPVRLELKVKGEKEVTASDIKANADLEIINKDLHLATLTDKKAELNLELIVAPGRGYKTAESREGEELEVNMIAVDSLFSPIKKIGFDVENVRVGQMTNWDKLTLNIETDGTITPEQALHESAQFLIDNFDFIKNNSEKKPEIKSKKVAETVETAEAEKAAVELKQEQPETLGKEAKETKPGKKPKAKKTKKTAK